MAKANTDAETPVGPLAGVRVVDLTDERAIYGAKLLADLGADVVRPEPVDGDPLRQRGPFTAAGDSLWFAFFASSRRFLTIDPATDRDCGRLRDIVRAADIVLTCAHGFAADALDMPALRADNPALVHIDTSSFSDAGPWSEWQAPDLVAGALGGSVAPTGDRDTPPLKSFGELNFMVAGAYVANAALSARYHAVQTGVGQRVSVPVHECIASTLEQVLLLQFYGELMGRAPVLPRQGGTHWSYAYTVMNGRDGAIMVTPTPDLEAQLMWLIEEEAQQDLLDPKYLQPENLQLLISRMMEALREWVAPQSAEALFFRAQERHAPYGWVLPIERVADNPQLEARQWWVPYQLGDITVQGPGAPYHFSADRWALRPPETVAGDAPETDQLQPADQVVNAIGWGARS